MYTQISEIAADGSTNGTKKASRKNHWARRTRLASTASAKDRTTSGIVVITVK